MKIIFIFLLLLINSFGCALCQLQIPTAKIYIDMNSNNALINWEFSKEFSDEVMLSFDKDRDNNFSQNELGDIKQSLLDYLIPRDYLINISYYINNKGKANNVKFNVDSNSILLQNNQLFFNYKLNFDLNVSLNDTISITFEDKEGFFNFVIHNVNFTSNKYETSSNINSNIAFLSLKNEKITKESNQIGNIESKDSFLALKLKELIEKIKINLTEIKETNSIIAIFWLLTFSFLYGIIHALGPGHGKSLVASYFLAKDRSYLKAFSMSALIGVVHTFSAFIFTFIVYFVVDTFLSKFLSDVTFYTTKISAFIIISIAIYLLYKKIPKKQKNLKWSITPHSSSCSCSACNTQSSDIGVVISAGIVPCAGTVTIFIFTLSMGLYFIGFLSAMFMSFGMSLIILFSALFSLSFRKKLDSKYKNLTKILEYMSLIFILSLGVLLFFSV